MKGRVDHAVRPLGDLLQDFIARIAHRGGQTLTIMNEASVTLQQVILLNRIAEAKDGTPSDLALALGMSLTSVSQMIDRLYRLDLVTRAEIATDRRRKRISLTEAGRILLARLREVRSIEFDIGTGALSSQTHSDLREILSRALLELDRPDDSLKADRAGRGWAAA